MADKILLEAFDKIKAIEESDDPFCIGAVAEESVTDGYTIVEDDISGADVEINYVGAKDANKWKNVPGIDGDMEDFGEEGTGLTITKLTKQIIAGIENEELILDTEFMNEDDIKTLINLGFDEVRDVNRGSVWLSDLVGSVEESGVPHDMGALMNVCEEGDSIESQDEQIAAIGQLIADRTEDENSVSKLSTQAFVDIANKMGLSLTTETLMDLAQSGKIDSVIKDVTQDEIHFKGQQDIDATIMTVDKAKKTVDKMAKRQAKKAMKK